MQIHQTDNSIGAKIYNAFSYTNFGWGTHIHKCYELIMVKSGTLHARLNGENITICENEALLVPPYHLHSYEKNENCTYHIAVFSSDYVPSFDQKMKNYDPNDYTIHFEKEEWDFLEKHLFPALIDYNVVKHPTPDEFLIKSCLYLMASRFVSLKTFERKSKDYSLFLNIVSYIEENFTQDISLSSLAQNLGYDDEYVSRTFNKLFNTNLKTLINMYRCEYAENLIETTDQPLTSIAMNSGFQSIRSFNRVFKEITGKNPSAIRRK